MAVRGDNSLYFSSGIDNSGLKSGANDAVGIVSNLASTIGAINPFAALAIGASAAFATIAASAYQMAKEFEQNMKEVETISKATQENFEGIASQVFAISKISPDAPAALAKAYYQIVSAGYDGAQGLKLLETASKAATAGVTTTEVAADGITTVLNAFKLSAEQADEVADAMFQTVKLGKTTFDQLSASLSQVAPLAAASGFSFQEVLAAVATLTKQGTPTAQAMTQIRSALEATTEVLGDGAAKSMTLQNAFQAIYDKAGGSQSELKELTGRMEAMNAILAIAGPNAKGAAADLKQLGESAGSAEEAFNRMAGSNVNQWKILGNRIKATTEEIGNSLLETSSSIAGFFNDALDDSEDLTASVRKQSNEFNILKATLYDANTPFEERVEILKKLKEQYPEYLSSLDLDKIKNDNLIPTLNEVEGALKAINDEQERRIKLSGISQKEIESRKSVNELRQLKEQAETDFYTAVERAREIAAKENIPLNFSLSDDIEDIYSEISKKLNGGIFSDGNAVVSDLLQAKKAISTYSGSLFDANKNLEKTVDLSSKLRRETYDNEDGFKQIVSEIEKIQSLGKLEPYKLYEYPDIKEAFKTRKDILNTFKDIDLTKDVKSLEPFLNNELKEIQEYAKARRRELNIDPTGGMKPTGDGEDTFSKMLKKREQEYKEYEASVQQLGQEAANKIFESLLKEGQDYGNFLKNQLEKTEDFAKQRAIALAASSNGIDLNRKKSTSVGNITPKGVMDFKIDTTSIAYYERQIKELNEKIRIEQDETKRRELQAERAKWQEKLNIAQSGAESTKSIYDTIPLHLNDLNNKELREYLEYWKKKLKIAKENGDKVAAEEAQAKIGAAKKEIANDTAEVLDGVSSALGEASNLMRKFGDEALADALDKLSGLASGVSQVVQGIATGGPLGMLQAAMGVLSGLGSLLSGEGKTSAYEKSMKSLEDSINRLGNEIELTFGSDKIEKQNEQLEEYKEKLELINAEVERLEAQRKVLGDDLFESLYGGMTRLNELQNELSDLSVEYANAAKTLREDITGTTRDSITQSLIDGFREGKTAIEDFADTFEELMTDALLKSFETQFLLKQVDAFYEKFFQLGEDNEYSAADIQALQDLFGDIITDSEERIKAINEILKGAGFAELGLETPDQRQGLSGAITNITEDTANILAGYMNAVRLDVRNGLNVAIQNSNYLNQIVNNTSYLQNIDKNITSLDGRMSTIEKGIQEFQAQG